VPSDEWCGCEGALAGSVYEVTAVPEGAEVPPALETPPERRCPRCGGRRRWFRLIEKLVVWERREGDVDERR
jgi:hypothetical protein